MNARFGKTISVSMFAAALLYSARGVEISIYSTCKRISQKLLRNVQKFLNLIYEGLKMPPFKEVRCNMEELVLQGPDGTSDIRVVNSYPSKVSEEKRCARVFRFAFALIYSASISSRSSPRPSLKCFRPTVRCLNLPEMAAARSKCSLR